MTACQRGPQTLCTALRRIKRADDADAVAGTEAAADSPFSAGPKGAYFQVEHFPSPSPTGPEDAYFEI